jgi:Tol biopolymer transport system component
MNADGGSIRRLTSHEALDERPSWSVSRPEIYFQSNRTGEFEIWKVLAVDPNAVTQVTRGGGVEPIEDPDGRRLYYRKSGFSEIWSKPVDGGEEALVARTAPSSGWTVGRGGIYIAGPDGNVVRVNLNDSTSALVARLLSPQAMGFAVSPDESCLLFHRKERAVSDLMVEEGFR